MRVRGRITLADLRATFGHLRRLSQLEVAGQRRRGCHGLRIVLRRTAWWIPAGIAFLITSRSLVPSTPSDKDVAFRILLGLVFVAAPLFALGALTRHASDFEILRMPSRRALLTARWLKILPVTLAYGIAWWAGAQCDRGLDDPAWPELAGCLVGALFLTLSMHEAAWGQPTNRLVAVLRALGFVAATTIAGLLAARVLALGAPDVRLWFEPLAHWPLGVSTGALTAILATVTALLARSTVRLADRSMLGAQLSGPDPERPIRAANEPLAPRSWPASHQPRQSRIRGDLALDWTLLRWSWVRARTPWSRIGVACRATLTHAWNVGGAAVLWFADPDSGRLPIFTAPVGLALFTPLGVEGHLHRWLWGCDYAVQIRARVSLILLTAWTPRALAVAAALGWHAIHYGRVSEEARVTALLLLALGLVPIGARACRACRPWARTIPRILDGIALGLLLVAVHGTMVMGSLPLSTGLRIGVVAAILGATATAWILTGLPEATLRRWYRKAAE